MTAEPSDQARTNQRLLYLLDHLCATADADRLNPVYSETLLDLADVCATLELYVLLVSVYQL